MIIGFDDVWKMDWQIWPLYGKETRNALKVAEFPLNADHQIEIFHNLKEFISRNLI